MKFRCQHCQAKYSIPDEKVRNKLLRIRCKKCKNLIEVSEASAADEPASGMTMPVAPVAGGKARAPGTGLLTGKTGPAPAPPPLPSVSRIVAQPPAIPDLAWFIGHKGKQEGPLSGPQLTERIMKGQLRPQMLAWREGMADWRRLDQVPELNAWLRHAESPKRPSAVPRSAPPAPPSSAGRAAGARAPASSPGSRRDSRKPLDPGGKLAPSPAAGAPARSAAGARSSLDDRLAAILGPVSKPAPAGRTAGKDRPAAAGGGSAAPAQAAQGDLDVAGTLPDTVSPSELRPEDLLGEAVTARQGPALDELPEAAGPAAVGRPIGEAHAAAGASAGSDEDDQTSTAVGHAPAEPAGEQVALVAAAELDSPEKPERKGEVGPSVLVQPPPGQEKRQYGNLSDLPTMAQVSPGLTSEGASRGAGVGDLGTAGLFGAPPDPADQPETFTSAPLMPPSATEDGKQPEDFSLGSMVVDELGRAPGPLVFPPEEARRTSSGEFSVIIRLKRANRRFLWATIVAVPLVIGGLISIIYYSQSSWFSAEELRGGEEQPVVAQRKGTLHRPLYDSDNGGLIFNKAKKTEDEEKKARTRGRSSRRRASRKQSNGKSARLASLGKLPGGDVDLEAAARASEGAGATGEGAAAGRATRSEPALDEAAGRLLGMPSMGARPSALSTDLSTMRRDTLDLDKHLSDTRSAPASLTKSQISNVVRSKKKAVTRCYDRQLKKGGQVSSGKIIVSFVIRNNGRTGRIKLSGSLSEGYFKRCVTQVFESLRFPTFRGKEIPVSYPLVLTSGG